MAEIYNDKSNTLLSGTSSNDYIYNGGFWTDIRWTDHDGGSNVTINTGAGNDYIFNQNANNVLINASDGNNEIDNRNGSLVAINTGSGNDSISNNSSSQVTINSGDGNDYIFNSSEGTNFTINVGNGEDTVSNYGDSVSIDGGAGDEDISNSGDNVTIDGGAGNDRILSFGDYVTIDGNTGDDNINSQGYYSSVNAGDGNDYIYNMGSYSTLNSGTGNDTISNDDYWGMGVVFVYNKGDGNDIIYGFKKNSTLSIGGGSYATAKSGNDIIVMVGEEKINLFDAARLSSGLNIDGVKANDLVINYTANTVVNGTSYSETIRNYANGTTIYSYAGDDFIYNSGDNVLFVYNAGDGNDTIVGFNATSTLQIASGTVDLAYTYDKDTFLQIGEERIVLQGLSSLESINFMNAIGEVESITISKAVVGSESGDRLDGKENYLVWAQGGSDTISNMASKVTILSGKDNDSIRNYSSDVTISGGAGNDTILNKTSYLSSKIETVSKTVRVSVPVYETQTVEEEYYEDEYEVINRPHYGSELYQVRPGDSRSHTVITYYTDQTIRSGFSDTPSYHTVTKQVQVGTKTVDSVVTSQVVVPVTIQTYNTNSTINGGAGDDYIVNEAANFVYFYAAGDGNDTIVGFNEASKLSVSGGDYSATASGNDVILKVGDGSITLKDTKGKVLNINDKETFNISWTLNGTTATYGTEIETLITVSGVKSLDGLTLDGSTVTVAKSALNQGNVTISDGYELEIANDVPQPETTAAGWTLSGNIATYKSASNTAGYELENNQIVYTAAGGGNTLVTVKGVKSLDGLALNDKVVTVSAKTLGTDKVTISDGYTLALANDVTKTSTSAAGWTLNNSIATYKNAATNAGYICDGKNISYVNASGGNTLLTVSGVKSLDGLALNDKVVTVSAKALGTDKVTISDGYTLALANDVTKTSTNAAGWTLNNSIATYKNAATNAGYICDGKNISYVNASGGNALITVSGVKSLDGLALNDKVVTVSAKALGTDKVTISDGYTLALANDVTKTSTSAAGWTLNNSTATYKNATTNAGYVCDGKNISYVNASGGNALITVNGVKSLDGLVLNDKVVTVSTKALGTDKVTISDGYTLALANDVTKPKTTKAWSLSKTKATYKQTTAAGYTLADNAINYSKKLTANLATVKGLKSGLKVSDGKISGVSIKGTTITLSKAALGTSKITVSDGYTLALGKNVTKSTTSEKWGLSKNTATLKRTKTAGYNLADNSISYSKKSTKTLATVTGVNSTKGISTKNNVVTLKASSLNKKVTVNDSDYEFNFASGDYKKTSITGSKKADVITSRGKNISISGGAGDDTINLLGSATTVKGGAGNDIISGNGKGNYSLWGGADNDTLYSSSGADKFIYGKGDGKDIIFGFDDKDTLTLDNLDFTPSYSKKNGTITLKVDGGSVTLKEFTATTFHINDETYKISGSKFKKQ